MHGRMEDSGALPQAGPLSVVRGGVQQFSLGLSEPAVERAAVPAAGAVPEVHIAAEQRNGIGFEQKYAERSFGLFKQLHRESYPATGLGPAICQRMVERSGGRMWAEGRPGQGATFHFALPVAPEQGQALPVRAVPVPPPAE